MKCPVHLRLAAGGPVVFEGEVEIPEAAAPQEWFTEEEASAYLRGAISPETLRRYRRQRRITFTKAGTGVLYRRAWLDDFLGERTEAPAVLDMRVRGRGGKP